MSNFQCPMSNQIQIKKFQISKIIQALLLLFLFLLPWQTRWIYESRFLNGGFWEYGSSSLYATEILLWLIIVLFGVERLGNREVWKNIFSEERYKQNKKLLHCYIVTLLFLGLSILLSLSSTISFNFVFHIIEAACFAVIMSATKDLPLKWLALWLGGVVQGIFAVIQFFFQEVFANKWLGLASHNGKELGQFVVEFGDQRWLRAYGSFGSPNVLGGFLAVMFVVGLVLFLDVGGRGERPFAPTRRWQIIITVGQLAILSGLIFSFSRGAWIAAVVGVVSVIASVAKQSPVLQNQVGSPDGGLLRRSSRDSLLAMTAACLLLITFFFITLKPLFLTRIQSQGRLENKSITERLTQYQQFSEIFWKHPLLGVGPGTYTLALYQNNSTLPVWRYQPIHNIYLLMLVEIGLVGFAIVTLLHCYIVTLLIKRNKLFLPILASILIVGLFDHWLWSSSFGLIFTAVVFGLSLGYRSDK